MQSQDAIRIVALFLICFCAFSTSGFAIGDEVVDFKSDIVPVLTKLGCNAGSCHGSASGRGGFKLSLYGSQPAEDYRAIVLSARGRRINLNDHTRSLLLRKPGGEMDHGGNQKFDITDPAGTLIAGWIEQGAKYNDRIKLTSFDVGRSVIEMDEVGGEKPFQFLATFSDGSQRDVTRWTVLTSNDESGVLIDGDSNRARILRPGRHIVLARFMDRVRPIEFLVPFYEIKPSLVKVANANLVDRLINRKLEQLNIPAGEQANDAAFLRRVSLDLTGRLPSIEQSESFMMDSAPEKRPRLIKDLLASNEFTDFWTYKIATQLRIRSQPADKKGAYVYHAWLREQIASRTSWRNIARELLLSKGDSHQSGPANFYRTTADARLQSEFVSESLMGVKLRCANCHNHPLDHWTQDDYHGLAAIFSQVNQGRVVSLNSTGENIHARTGKPAVPRIPGDSFVTAIVADARVPLTNWMLNDANPYFARSMVNRIWKSLMGRGLVEPVDDLRQTNPATHPDLLNQLAEDFTLHDYDLRHTIELVCNSQAYQREIGSPDSPQYHAEFYADAMLRPLQAEVLADAICDITGIAEKYAGLPQGTRAIELYDSRISSPALDVLGRCSREESCESESSATGGLASRLHLLNGPLLNAKIANRESELQLMMRKDKSTEQIVLHFYSSAFSRKPDADELTYWRDRIDGVGESADQKQRQQRLEDFVWSVLSSKEFTTNH